MPAITMIIWLGTTPAQVQAVQSAQPTVYKQDLIRVEERRVQAGGTAEPKAKTQAALPSSTR